MKTGKNTSLNEELLKNGLAWIYEKYCKIPICEKWKKFEENAQKIRSDYFRKKTLYRPGIGAGINGNE